MKIRMYAIRDVKADFFNNPIALRTDMEAMRAFQEACRPGQETMISSYPEDYVLVHVGEFDNNNGVVYPCDTPAVVLTGIDAALAFKRKVSNGSASTVGDEARLQPYTVSPDSQVEI